MIVADASLLAHLLIPNPESELRKTFIGKTPNGALRFSGVRNLEVSCLSTCGTPG